LEPEFCNHMLDLFKFLTNPNKIVIKKIGGVEQTCRKLCDYIEVLANALNNDTSLDDPQSFIAVKFSLLPKSFLNFYYNITIYAF